MLAYRSITVLSVEFCSVRLRMGARYACLSEVCHVQKLSMSPGKLGRVHTAESPRRRRWTLPVWPSGLESAYECVSSYVFCVAMRRTLYTYIYIPCHPFVRVSKSSAAVPKFLLYIDICTALGESKQWYTRCRHTERYNIGEVSEVYTYTYIHTYKPVGEK